MEALIESLTFRVELIHYLLLSAIIFIIGIVGIILNKRNLLIILMAIELMLLAVNINLIAFSAHLKDLQGHIFTIFILTVAAAETAIGLAIVMVCYKNNKNIEIQDLNKLKG